MDERLVAAAKTGDVAEAPILLAGDADVGAKDRWKKRSSHRENRYRLVGLEPGLNILISVLLEQC